MGVRINSGTITISIQGMELTDPSDEDDAIQELGQAVRGAIENGCEAYRNGLSLVDITLDDVEPLSRVATVRLTATVTVQVEHDQDGPTPEDWAGDYGWNFLAFEASDVDFDYSVDDHDSGEEADWRSDESVNDPRENMRRETHRARADLRLATDLNQRVINISRQPEGDTDTAVRAEKLTAIRCLFDVDLAHQVALDIDSHHAWNRMESNS